jgi:hypothetical protein
MPPIRHLVIGTKVDGLEITPGPKIPEMDPVAIFVREQILADDPVFELRRQRTFARHQVVARKFHQKS